MDLGTVNRRSLRSHEADFGGYLVVAEQREATAIELQ